MADESELEAMVVSLSGDMSELKAMYSDAKKETEETAKTVEAAAERIEKITNTVESFAGAVVKALAADKMKDWLHDAFEKFQEAEAGELKLRAALEANGREVESLMEDYGDFAAAMQEVTTLDDDAVLSLLKVAESYELTGSAAKKASKDAIALAAISGSNAESMIRMTAAMAKGDTATAMRFARMIPQLRGVKDETEFLEKYNKLLTAGWKTAEAEAGSMSGMLTQLQNDYDNLKEEIGGLIAEGVKPLVMVMKDLVGWFADLSPEMKKFATVSAMVIASIIGISAAVAALGLIFNTLFGGMGIWIGLFALAAAGVGAWAAQTEGLGEMWEQVRDQLEGFWQRVKPAWVAFLGWAEGLWNRIAAGGKKLYDRIAPVMAKLFAWIQDHAEDLEKFFKTGLAVSLAPLILAIELTVQHFERMVDFVVDDLMPVIEEIGKVGAETWEEISAATKEFIDEYGPAIKDFAELVIAQWEAIKRVAIAVWDAIKWVIVRQVKAAIAAIQFLWTGWKATWKMALDTVVNVLARLGIDAKKLWKELVEGVRFAMWAAEFAFRNIEKIAKLSIWEVRHGFADLANQLEHFFTVLAPAWVKHFANVTQSLFTQVFDYVQNTLKFLVDRLKFVANNLSDIVADKINLEDVFKGMPKLKLEIQPFVAPDGPKPTGFMDDLQKDIKTWRKELAQSWEDFLRAKQGLNPMELPKVPEAEKDKAKKEAKDLGKELGEELNKGLEGEMLKFEYALIRSQEALQRIQEFKDRLRNMPTGTFFGSPVAPVNAPNGEEGIGAQRMPQVVPQETPRGALARAEPRVVPQETPRGALARAEPRVVEDMRPMAQAMNFAQDVRIDDSAFAKDIRRIREVLEREKPVIEVEAADLEDA